MIKKVRESRVFVAFVFNLFLSQFFINNIYCSIFSDIGEKIGLISKKESKVEQSKTDKNIIANLSQAETKGVAGGIGISSELKNDACFAKETKGEAKVDVQQGISVKAKEHEKLKIKLVFIGKSNNKIDVLLNTMKKDFEFSGQFDVIKSFDDKKISKKEDITKYFTQDCRLGVFVNAENAQNFAWRLYDLEYAQMVIGGTYQVKGSDARNWAHKIDDKIWPNLTGEPGFFSTKIVYSKTVSRNKKRDLKHIYIADYNGENERLLIGTQTVNIAPRWNSDPKNPLVFYSEHTSKNVRLMVADMHGRRRIASNFDGLNILSAFSPDGKRFAYCASKGLGGMKGFKNKNGSGANLGSCNIYFYDGILKKLTNSGNNFAPTFADNGNSIYFCSDENYKLPKIFKYDLSKINQKNYKPECITKDLGSKEGFYVATVFNDKKNLLAYAKMVGGLMQIFTYNPANGEHKQITFGSGNKEECSWSPCGNYLLFSVEHNNKSRLAVQNLLTGKMNYVSKQKDSCFYPFWSPFYEDFPNFV